MIRSTPGLLWSLDAAPYPIDGIRQTLEKAIRRHPTTTASGSAWRTWQSVPGASTRRTTGSRRCERATARRPASSRARLEWAKAADRPDDAFCERPEHLSASTVPRRLLQFCAWLAAKAGDRAAERSSSRRASRHSSRAAAGARTSGRPGRAGWQKPTASPSSVAARPRSRPPAIATRALVSKPDPAAARPSSPVLPRPGPTVRRPALVAAGGRSRDPAVRTAEADDCEARLARSVVSPRRRGPDARRPPRADRRRRSGRKTDRAGIVITSPPSRTTPTRGACAFTFDNGRSDLRQLPETMSGGVAFSTSTATAGSTSTRFRGGRSRRPRTTIRLATACSAIAATAGSRTPPPRPAWPSSPGGYGHGVAVGDYDNDGRPDLFVTRWRSYALYHNLGGDGSKTRPHGRGLGGDRDWPTSAAWADLDNDGDLDLYVCHYVRWDETTPRSAPIPANRGRLYVLRPAGFPGARRITSFATTAAGSST